MSEPVFTEIDHVAIAVRDLDAAVAYYGETYGVEVEHREVVERDGVEEALLKVADSYVQLLTPTRDDSPVAKWMEKRGEGDEEVGQAVDRAYSWTSSIRVPYAVFGWTNATVVPRLPGRGASSMTMWPPAFTRSSAAAQSSTR